MFWPTAEELEEIKQEDEEFYPKLTSKIEEMHRRREERENYIEARYAEVEKKAKEYPKIIEAYRKQLRDQQAAIDEEKRVKDDKIKEIQVRHHFLPISGFVIEPASLQSYFGFAIDVTDPRFAAMMAKKELEEKQVRKLTLLSQD